MIQVCVVFFILVVANSFAIEFLTQFYRNHLFYYGTLLLIWRVRSTFTTTETMELKHVFRRSGIASTHNLSRTISNNMCCGGRAKQSTTTYAFKGKVQYLCKLSLAHRITTLHSTESIFKSSVDSLLMQFCYFISFYTMSKYLHSYR